MTTRPLWIAVSGAGTIARVAFSFHLTETRCVIWSRIQPRKYFEGESQQIYVLQTDKGNIISFQEKNMKLKKKKKKKKEKYVLIVC